MMRIAVLIVALVGTLSASAAAQTKKYDGFSGHKLAASKWLGLDSGSEPGASLDELRIVAHGELQLAERVVGGRADNTGRPGASKGVYFKKHYTALKLTMRLVALAFGEECNVPGAEKSFASIVSYTTLFHHGSNDVYSGFALVHEVTDGPGVMRILGVLSGIVLGVPPPMIPLGTVSIGTAVDLTMRWEPENNLIAFQRNDETVQTMPYTVDDSIAVTVPESFLAVSAVAPNCKNGPRPEAEIAAAFDNIFINP
jgi:hypothetical protein